MLVLPAAIRDRVQPVPDAIRSVPFSTHCWQSILRPECLPQLMDRSDAGGYWVGKQCLPSIDVGPPVDKTEGPREGFDFLKGR